MDFLEKEAIESSGSDEDDFLESAKKRKETKKKHYESSDESEEEEDEEQIGDLINDDIEEEGGSDEEISKKRLHSDDEEEDLEDDEYALLEENLGYRVDRKKKLRRVKRFEDSDNEDEVQDERQAIANELFDGDDDENEEGEIKRERQPEIDPDRYNRISGSEESESEEDDFIVDDNDLPIIKPKKKKGLYRHNDEAMQQAQDIFGVEFDFDDLQNLDNDDYGDFDEENEYEEDEEGEHRMVSSKKKSKKRVVKKSIFEIYEPSELERNHLTERDNEIRNIDLPERFQCRSIPITEATEEELKEEAEWIWKNAFNTCTISVQDPDADYPEDKRQPIAGRKSRSTVNKIKDALNFIRNKKNEVPFIAFYRKEYFVPDLNINDLWVIYKWDEKWCQLQLRKDNIVKLIKNMQDYQIQKIINQGDQEDESSRYSRVINEKDIVRAKQCQSFDDIKDCWLHFQLYYGNEIPLMKQEQQQNKKLKKRLALKDNETAEGGEGNNLDLVTAPDDDEDIQNKLSSLKLAQRKNMYTVCRDSEIIQLVRRFGLAPEQLGENLRDNYTRHHVNKCDEEPLKLASGLTSNRFNTPEQVVKAAIYMAACQISSDPQVRKCVRQVYFERAKLHVKPTKKGRREIDENHPCYAYKYLKNKPVTDLIKDQYLQIHIAQQTGLLEVKFTIDSINTGGSNRHHNNSDQSSYFEEIKQLYEIDEYSKIVQLWNDIRNEALKQALEKFLYPQLEKELKSKLIQECQEQCMKNCSKKLYDWLKIAPYRVDNPQITDDEDFDTRDGIRVMGFAFMPNSESPAFAAILDSDGIVIDFIRLPYFLLKRHEFATEQEKHLREQDRNKLRQFILNKKPHVIAVGSETMLARTVIGDINDLIMKLMETDQFPPISVELVDNELSVVFQECKRAQTEFPSFPPLLRQAVSLARRLLDPLIEFSQLCTPDDEILCLKYHPLQQYLPSEELLETLYLEFVNRVNEVGVDLNRFILFPHTSLLIQFVCGLGPRKSASLLRSLKKKQTPILESRTQLVTIFGIGAIVFINCAGFIKIDTSQLTDNNTDTYIEVLDSTRVHPETYEWARKMAVDALEYDDDQNESNPAGALEEILENPEKLKDLDLDAFAEELERQDLGYRRITLYDIRTELNCRYKDLRESYQPPTADLCFHLLTRETPESFCIGKMVMGKVIGITRSRPQDDQYDKANPIRNETGLWQCPFCLRSDYGELSDVWAHFDAKECPGEAIGVRMRLDNGVTGSIDTKYISDKEIKNPEERVHIGMAVHARILRINVEKFFVNLTCRSSDLLDVNNEFRPQKDYYYDHDSEKQDKESEEESKKKKKRQTYIKRIIVHPSFHNIDYGKAEKKLAEMNNGDAIIRPSSKGINHLTLSWRVYNGITAHVDITEENKANAFSIGKQLFINGEAYEDLDEILARYVHPMASLAHEIISFKYFIYADGAQKEVLESLLLEEKKKQPNKIHYFLSPSKEMPGKFALAYLPRNKVIIEFVTVTPEGIRYRKNLFRSLNELMRWFKDHFKDPIPQATPSHTITPNINQAAIRKAAASMPSHLFNSLQTLQTPQSTYGSMGPPLSTAIHARSSQPTPSLNTPGQNWPSSNRGQTTAGRSGNDWRQQIENSSSYNRKTPRDGNTRTPLYNTPGASSMMSISPEHT